MKATFLFLVLTASILCGPAVPALAQQGGQKGQNVAKIIPYGQVSRDMEKRFKGRVVGQRLEGSGDDLHYQLRVLKKDGSLVFVTVDARTGRILETRGE